MTFLLIGAQELLIIALVLILLFGGKKIPELMRGLGRGVRSFKEGMNETDATKPDSPADPSTADKAGHPTSGDNQPA